MIESRNRRRIRLLVFSTLFPNSEQLAHGVFVWRRLRELLSSGAVDARVVAPVPWFPEVGGVKGEYGIYSRIPGTETREGVDVLHPRYVVVPKIGMHVAPFSLAVSAYWAVRRILAAGYDFDLIDAHYYYPDGVAASLLGRWLGRPVVITARGTDINLIPQDPIARWLILGAARRAAASIAVCEALKDEMIRLGMEADRITVLRNGVDLQHFQPMDRQQARDTLGLDNRRWLLSVGLLIERKGHDIAIRALRDCKEWGLIIAGEGPFRLRLESLARECGVADRVRFAGLVSQRELPAYYSAADALVLASSREGWANVLLEAMACGTPAIASPVWGTPEVVRSRAAGVLMTHRTPEALVEAVRLLLADYPDRAETRAYAEAFGWDTTTRGQLQIFERLLASSK
jgi:glycosyltransferase involved in cell wall biosynthesis